MQQKRTQELGPAHPTETKTARENLRKTVEAEHAVIHIHREVRLKTLVQWRSVFLEKLKIPIGIILEGNLSFLKKKNVTNLGDLEKVIPRR